MNLHQRLLMISLKFSPGLAKEFTLIGGKCNESGWDTRYLISDRYKPFVNQGPVFYFTGAGDFAGMVRDSLKFLAYSWITIVRFIGQLEPAIVMFYNAHPLNLPIAIISKIALPDVTCVLCMHEPNKSNINAYNLWESRYFALGELLQALALRSCDKAVVFSEYGGERFFERFPAFHGDLHVGALMIPASSMPDANHRSLVSFVGGVNSARPLDLFLQTIQEHQDRAVSLGLAFEIMTRSRIPKDIGRSHLRNPDLIQVENRPLISDAEIEKAMKQSLALYLSHTSVTQSGNVPVAFRSGTPVICRDLPGLSQHVKHKERGYLIPVDAKPADLWRAIEYVYTHFPRLSKNARDFFDERFSESSFERYYPWLATPWPSG